MTATTAKSGRLRTGLARARRSGGLGGAGYLKFTDQHGLLLAVRDGLAQGFR